MPRILVADDNSNIQRMVALALAGEGIEVVAVSNGEAAVRKLLEADMDLVLADIFMPVRSGYEVCEFVKHDPRYLHIPVVLLVGAFDPLDEVEAQRVSADGILKKPFVPPDPLINMVKALLAKSAGERLVAVAVPVAASAAEGQPERPPIHAVSSAAAFPAIQEAEPLVSEFSDAPPEEYTPLESAVTFGAREKPLAFRSLVETPVVDDADLTVTASRDPILGEPAFWTPAPAPVEEAAAEEAIQEHTWSSTVAPLPLGVEGEPLPSIEPPSLREPEIDEGPRVLKSDAQEKDQPAPLALAPLEIAHVKLNGNQVFEAAVPLTHEIELPSPEPEHVAAPLLELVHESLETAATKSAGEDSAAEPSVKQNGAKQDNATHDVVTPEHEAATPEMMWQDLMSDDLAEKSVPAPSLAASEVAASKTPEPVSSSAAVPDHASIPDVEEPPAWLAPVRPIFPGSESLWAGKPESLVETQEVAPSEPEQVEPASVWPPAFVPALEKEAVATVSSELAKVASPAAEHEHVPVEAAAEPISLAPTPAPALVSAVTESAPPSAEMVEATVTRIVERMQPKVIEVVTREILRPLVEALVRRELNKK